MREDQWWDFLMVAIPPDCHKDRIGCREGGVVDCEFYMERENMLLVLVPTPDPDVFAI
jgi:hypothetical protein